MLNTFGTHRLIRRNNSILFPLKNKKKQIHITLEFLETLNQHHKVFK